MSFIINYGFIIFFVTTAIAFAVQPLFLDKISYSKDESILSLKREKTILYRNIKELEMEYEIGNIEELDFKKRRIDLKRKVSKIILKLEDR
ncbi:MAG: hypothetical protein CMG08_04265 [Candidatus Marinimicrobia bacterium]|nr:hypothetical protein [Candidatus Neomarinimicrobiota bacterium]